MTRTIARLAQADELAALEARCYDDPWPLVACREAVENQLQRVYMYQEGDMPIGFAVVQVLFDEVELLRIGIVPERRGEGLSTAFLQHLIDALVAEGVAVIDLEVRSDNVPARALYRRMGFQTIAERTQYYKDGCDAIIMQRR